MQITPRRLSLLLCAATFVCAWIFYAHTFPEGDDVVYWDWYRDIRSRHGSFFGWLIFSFSNWEGANGRLANMLTPFFLYFPPSWLKGLLDSVILTLLLYFGLRLSCLSHRYPKGMVAITLYAVLTLVTFPWWDSMTLTDCVLNYPASDMLGLAVLTLWFSTPQRQTRTMAWGGALLGLIAGAMHEASGVALSAGLITGLIVDSERRADRLRIFMTVGVNLGALFTLSSPGIWSRFLSGTEGTPDAPVWYILLTGSFYVIILILLLLFRAIRITAGTKDFAATMWRSLTSRPDITLLTVATLVSTLFTAVGGVIGRSGWFGQSFALIALFRMAPTGGWNRSLRLIITTLLTIIYIWLWDASARVQVKLGREGNDVIAAYLSSPDGIVYYDYTEEEDLPIWLLRRPGGVPDADDMFPLREYNRLRPDGAPFVVLPTAFRSIDLTNFRGTLKYKCHYLTDRLPEDYVTLNPDSPVPGPMETQIEGRRMTIMPVAVGTPLASESSRTIYFITPRRIDPGDK